MRIGWTECLIVLVVLIFVLGLAYRGGYARGRRHQQLGRGRDAAPDDRLDER